MWWADCGVGAQRPAATSYVAKPGALSHWSHAKRDRDASWRLDANPVNPHIH